jgi:hypothetical protein
LIAAMGIPLVQGRDFNDTDTAASPRVVIVNETAARRLWPQQNALGRHLRRGRGELVEVVGVARDSNYHRLGEAAVPWLYVPALQAGGESAPQLTLVIKTERDPTSIIAAIKREVLALDPAWPIFDFQTLRQNMELQFFLPRVMATLLGTLGLFGLALAMIGVFGLVAYAVVCRTREIGVRIAVGATAGHILALFLKRGVVLAALDIGLGTAVAVPLGLAMSATLAGVTPNDWSTLVATAGLLLFATIVAGLVPARRATKVDPMIALRAE